MQRPGRSRRVAKAHHRPRGFPPELFAAEPQIDKPLCMNWDERGRLWIAETIDYPNELKPEGLGRDRIKICEDTDGDGRADKFTIFAEKLSIPTSLTFSQGGLIVHQASQTLFLKDNDGDDKADGAPGPVQRVADPRHPCRTEQPPLRTRQLDLGDGRVLGLLGEGGE